VPIQSEFKAYAGTISPPKAVISLWNMRREIYQLRASAVCETLTNTDSNNLIYNNNISMIQLSEKTGDLQYVSGVDKREVTNLDKRHD